MATTIKSNVDVDGEALKKLQAREGMWLEPLADLVLILQDEAVKVSAGGIILPQNAQERQQIGRVVEVGPGRPDMEGRLIPMVVQRGMRVLFDSSAARKIEVDGIEVCMVSQQHVLAEVHENAAVASAAVEPTVAGTNPLLAGDIAERGA
jgi:chaperonin GroES